MEFPLANEYTAFARLSKKLDNPLLEESPANILPTKNVNNKIATNIGFSFFIWVSPYLFVF
jgi:hypothetical protein